MLDIIIVGLLGFAIGIGVGVFIMWPYREKYRVCRIERLNNEAMLSQSTPRRDARGRFLKVAA